MSRECFFNREMPAAQSLLDSDLRDAGFSAPLGDGLGFAVERNAMIGPFIVGLFAMQYPARVFLGIWTIIVDAVEFVFRRWPWAAIRVKGHEVSEPAVAHVNASGAVVLVVFVLRICATVNHVLPNSVLRRIGQSMCEKPSMIGFAFEASA